MLHVSKVDSLQAEKLEISASRLKPSTCYRFLLLMHHPDGVLNSHCIVKSDASGNIDLEKDAPVRGTYEGVDPMGLFISLQPREDVRSGHLFSNMLAETSYYTLKLLDPSNSVLSSISLKKHWLHPLVSRIEIAENGLYGYLFKPPGEGPFPCILYIPGASGTVPQMNPAMLASRGFLVLTVAYFGYKEDLPKTIEDVDVEFFQKPINYLTSLPYFSGKLGLFGYSFGGTIAYLLATRYSLFSAVISVNCFESFFKDGVVLKENGEHFHVEEIDRSKIFLVNGVINGTEMTRELARRLTRETSIEWENVSKGTKFRIVHGTDDMVLCGTTMFHNMRRNLRAHGIHVESVLAPSGHFLDPPYFPHNSIIYNKYLGRNSGLGGLCSMHGKAQETVWQGHIDFFTEHIGAPSQIPDYERETVVEVPRELLEHKERKSKI